MTEKYQVEYRANEDVGTIEYWASSEDAVRGMFENARLIPDSAEILEIQQIS